MRTNRPPTHEPRKQIQWPPGRLLNDTLGGGHKRGNHIHALRDTRHADVAALADEHVQPDCDGERVREGVAFFGTAAAFGADGIPDVPFVEADCGPGLGCGYVVFNAGEVDEGGGYFDGAFGGERGCGVGEVRVRAGVHVDAVHVDEGDCAGGEGGVRGEEALLEGVVVPGCGAVLTAEYEDEAGVEEFQSWKGLARRLGPRWRMVEAYLWPTGRLYGRMLPWSSVRLAMDPIPRCRGPSI